MTTGAPSQNRRRTERLPAAAFKIDLRVRLRAGHDALLVDVSRLGILLDSSSRLLPGHRCTVRVTVHGVTEAIHGKVLRASVVRLDPVVGAIYRGAIAFDEERPANWVVTTQDGQ